MKMMKKSLLLMAALAVAPAMSFASIDQGVADKGGPDLKAKGGPDLRQADSGALASSGNDVTLGGPKAPDAPLSVTKHKDKQGKFSLYLKLSEGQMAPVIAKGDKVSIEDSANKSGKPELGFVAYNGPCNAVALGQKGIYSLYVVQHQGKGHYEHISPLACVHEDQVPTN